MHQTLLVTGATGALGPHLVAELLAAGAAKRIAVLMRRPAASTSDGFRSWLDSVANIIAVSGHATGSRPALDPDLTSLQPVAGDLSRERLGFSADDNARLLKSTEVIVHAAADTRFNAPVAEQWDVNVAGTRRMLEWASKCPRLRRFILVSSTYVAGSRTGRIDESAGAVRPDFVTNYQRTKWEAEQLALASALPVAIARISLITGSHANGFVNRPGALHNLIRWFGRGLVPVLPGTPQSTVDLISAETAARCLTRAVVAMDGTPNSDAAAERPIWHFAAGAHAAPLGELIDLVFEQFNAQPGWRRNKIPKAQVVDRHDFDELVRSAGASDHAGFAQVMSSVSSFLPDLLYPKVYDTSRAELLYGGPLPLNDWRETLRRVIHCHCLRAPARARRVDRPMLVPVNRPATRRPIAQLGHRA